MQVMSMVVNDEFGVMQRILQEFTRRKINVETIVVGKCEIPGKARVVLTIVDKVQADAKAVATDVKTIEKLNSFLMPKRL